MTTTTYIFNQYYIDFLKRIKTVAKDNKDTSTTANAVYRSIKESYVSLDKTSDEYVKFVKTSIPDSAWESYVDDISDWMVKNKDKHLYENITLETVGKLIDDEYLCQHFVTVFYIFRNELSDEVSSHIVKIFQSIDGKNLIAELEDENIKKALTNLQTLRDKNIKEKAGIDMNFIEDTTLGKLAKEILEDVDVGKLQKSMQNNNDILKAIGDPDSGFADIITNVSKKMANKISNGELKQENLIQDAMKFASIMPNLFGGAGGSSNKKRGGAASTPDLSNIMSMMSSMMGNNNDDDIPLGNLQKNAQKGTRKVFNESALKKLAKAKKLKRKLQEKKKAERNAATATDETVIQESSKADITLNVE